jgi:hypothetical protein
MEAFDWSKLSEPSCARATAGWLAAERIGEEKTPWLVSTNVDNFILSTLTQYVYRLVQVIEVEFYSRSSEQDEP